MLWIMLLDSFQKTTRCVGDYEMAECPECEVFVKDENLKKHLKDIHNK